MKLSYTSFASFALLVGVIFAMSQVGVSGWVDPSDLTKKLPSSGLEVGFYHKRCPDKKIDIQGIIEHIVTQHFYNDRTTLPAFLRMQFHDCFVKGCDASILIYGSSSERNAAANAGVREYDFLDDLKAKVESICPDTVSCADLIAIATATVLKLGGGPNYPVQTGRRDGSRSNAADVKLPRPSVSVPESYEFFKAKGFTLEEMVALLGCHTVGIAHCGTFQNRLYPDNTEYDSAMDEALRWQLIAKCPPSKTSTEAVLLDQGGGGYSNYYTDDKFDVSFFQQILRQRGVLTIDQALARDPSTASIVASFANNPGLFNAKLGQAMVKLQAVDVLTGLDGNIRKVCSKFNY
ncbi:peroxidase 57-like [Silene latifolia]|uniref:peroxidase 57-like n=1 Tax=Silene latifolia TaxID=37657 RepID=UPI003D77981D